MPENSLTASVVVCTATREREPLLRECVAALLAGDRVPDELLVVVDQNPELEADLRATLPAPVRVLRTRVRGISEGRNIGIETATSDVVAFVDDDAAVEPDWMDRILAPFAADAALIGAGGRVAPIWDGDAQWLPPELLWVAGCTYAGHREDAGTIRNPIGCNMAFRRDALLAVGAFANEFGKQGDKLLVCDETELCLRLAERFGAGRIVYVPDAAVRHHVSVSRLTARALARRAASEGISKALLHRRHRGSAVAAENGYVRRLVLRTCPQLLAEGVRGGGVDAWRGLGAVLLTLGVTAGHFGVALVPRRPPASGAGS
jgi:GT2 family glycosyltransferase